jgi:hypothetical protein
MVSSGESCYHSIRLGIMEERMISRIVSGGALAALAGAAMLALTSGPASAFTLSSPSLERPVAAADVEHVWWDRWGRWHPNWGWGPRWGWGWRPVYRPYYYAGPVRRCWWTAWGVRRCQWY